MDLQELITRLENENQDLVAENGFGEPMSWRGHYHELAFEPSKNVTVNSMLLNARSAINKEFTGYKGGEFMMVLGTTVHIANYGECDLDGDDVITPDMLQVMFIKPDRCQTLRTRIEALRDEAQAKCEQTPLANTMGAAIIFDAGKNAGCRDGLKTVLDLMAELEAV